MQSIKIAENEELTESDLLQARLPLSFHERQFYLEPTYRQKRFDWVFGVAMPTLCFAADPFVFADEMSLLYKYNVFAYVLSITSIMAMAAWLLWGEKLGELRPYLGGLFLAGSVVSLIVGVILAPFSLIGMILVIGFLGFTPLLSSYVFLRNGVRAIKGSKLDLPTPVVYRAVILAALYSLIVPFVLNF